MRSERDKMLAGELYDPNDTDLVAGRLRSRGLCQRLNALPAGTTDGHARLLAELFGKPVDTCVTPPFQCDYGLNIEFGSGVYFNFGCVVLDVAPVRIGHRVLFAPGVHIYSASHPMSVAARRSGLELGFPVTIDDDAWIGGGSLICPGVTIGAGAVIGAGSVVTRDIPAGVFAAGNPCRVIRTIGADE